MSETCACKWPSPPYRTIGESVPHLAPCAGHEVYGTWRANEATKVLRERLEVALREVTPHLPGGESGSAMWRFAESVRAALDASK